MRHVDLAIVGAGFAGLSCAQAAAARGLSTAVIDRKTDPGANMHTTGLLVKEVADEWDVPRKLTRKIRQVRLYAPSMRYVDLYAPGYYFLATDTPALLRWLARQAWEAGAWVMCESPFEGARYEGRHIRLSRQDMTCRYLIGADGARSRVAEAFGLTVNRQYLTGVEAEFECVRGVDEDCLHVFLDSHLAPGYIAWVIPGVGGVTQVGLASRQPHRPQLKTFIEKVSGLFDFGNAKEVGRRGGLIPVGGPLRRIGTDRVMLIGDAAGMVSPLTAGGIHTAVHFGRAAGVAVTDHLLDGGPDPLAVVRRQCPSFMFKRMMRTAIDLRPPNRLIDLLIGNAAVQRVAQTVFFHHRGLFTLAAWRQMVLGAGPAR